MTFKSLIFPFFLLATLLLYWGTESRDRRKWLLLAASFLFYGWWDWRFLGLLVLASGLDYLCGLGLDRFREPSKRRWILAAGLTGNLATLCFFKYFNFFSESLRGGLALAGLQADWPTLHIVLPVGISFYTFQSMSYTIDVYRGRMPACKDPALYFVFVTYFPQLVAGPIERAVDLVPQLSRLQRFDEGLARRGLRHVLWGYFLKVAVADNLAPLVDRVYGNVAAHSGAEALLATYYFAFQIYGDFAGYTHIAIGASALFGIRLTQNFRSPYLSRSVKEFWTRWHITLSSFFREYVYVWALGGSRVSRRRHVVNILLTFALSGFWHGANWTFIVWGILNGIFYFWGSVPPEDRPWRSFLRALATFHMVCAGWVFFRAASLSEAAGIFRKIFTSAPELSLPVLGPAALITLVVGVELLQRRRPDVVALDGVPRPARLGIYCFFIIITLLAGYFSHVPFIYFQF